MRLHTPLVPALLAAAMTLSTPAVMDGQVTPMSSSAEALIADAMRAGPSAITQDATIMTWPDTEGGEPTQLRAGTNDWTCFASSPMATAVGGHDPMCMDAASLEFMQAFMEHREPAIESVGTIYMLEGDEGASNADPFATSETSDNDWVVSGPHVMIVVPDPTTLDALTADHRSGGPWVMWQGTPWAHLMVPVGH